jgi:hypothetical protein
MRHLTDSELAGFLDGDLSDAERARAEAHLDACDECRTELIEVARLVADAPEAGAFPVAPVQISPPTSRARQRRPSWPIPAGIVGLAAAAGLAMILFWPAAPGWNEQPMQERFGTEATPRLETHFPPDGGAVPRDEVRFAWASHDTGSYRIMLTAEDGALVWSATLADTVVAPPAELDLPAGRTFYWYVDAIGIGVVGRTGAHAFTIAP